MSIFNILDGSITNQIIRRTIRGEAKGGELNYLYHAVDRAGDGDGLLEIGDVVDFAQDKVSDASDVVGAVVEFISSIF